MGRLTSKSSYWIIVLSLLSLTVIAVMGLLAYLLLTLPGPAAESQAIPTPHPTLSLPTVPPPTATLGPPASAEVAFTAEKPIKGFSNCTKYGFKGVVKASNDDRLAGIQITIWEEGVGLFAVDTTDEDGAYVIEIKDQPTQRKFWVQVYQNDVPASDPLSVETQADCRQGYQIYQINWREKEE